MDIGNVEKNINLVNLIQNIPSGFCIYNTKLQHIEFTIWNKHMLEITGYTIKEINEIGWHNIFFNKYSISELIGDFNICEDKEYEIISKSGVRKIICINTSIINTEDGEENTLVLVKDITKNKQAQQEFKEIQERLENQLIKSELMLLQVTENSLDMITISDINGIIQYGTPSNEDTLGYTFDEFVGLNILDLVYPEDLNYTRIKLQEMTETFKEKTIQCSLRCKDGSYKCLEIKGKVLNNYGQIHGFIFSARDISDRKKAEKLESDMNEKSRLLSEAAEYEKLRTDFFANISHELKTPINVILSSLQLLSLKTNNSHETNWCHEEYKKYPAIMKQNCYRLIRLINNLIDVTKIDSGYLNLSLINANIVNVVEDITLSVVDYTANKGISLIFDTEVEEKTLACDPDKIERIILNLISNAVKFTEPGGSIFVNIIDKGQDLIISVKDTGIGISKDKQKIIFERFVQVDKSLARNREGSGIGLSLVKSLVEMHNGTITVKSELNKGSSFIITLPNHLIDEKNDIVHTNEHYIQENSEKINIEFSDIYC